MRNHKQTRSKVESFYQSFLFIKKTSIKEGKHFHILILIRFYSISVHATKNELTVFI